MAKTAKSIQFDEEVLEKADAFSKKMKISRNQIVNEALKLWLQETEKKFLVAKLKEASQAIQRDKKDPENVWVSTLGDGLSDD